MVKNFCDLCEVEIKQSELVSQFIYVEKNKTSLLNNKGPALKQISNLFCENCTLIFKNTATNLFNAKHGKN